MKFLGENPFYTLLLLTEKPGKWPRWSLAPLPLALAALAGLAWASAAGPAWGWATAGLLLVMALADWALLSFLPRSGSSFGPVQPPFLALSALRGLLAVAAALLARWGAALPWALHGTVQLAIWFLAAYGTLVEPFLLQVTRLQIVTPRLANPGGPLRVVQLSDLHVERLTRRDRALPDTVAGLDADVMVLTGDYLNTTYNQDPQALADLEELLAQLEAPGQRYGIWGSPEVDCTHLLRPILQAAGQLTNAEPTKVYNQNMSVIPSSEQSLAASAHSKISTLTWVELWVPLIVVIVGAILLLLGCYAFLRARARKAT